ncbi:MAG TPA: NAD(P)H-hydrate dehydratase [Humisphaera sp.]|jgi:NAD(P)H-hydrate epimerase|nr:NAD(P)H-hydrate dehydratase [Humisphaera sp.]
MKRIESIPPLPPRPVEGHKGMFGRVLVVGGNDEMIGAPALAGTAALRMGAGLVQVGVPQSILPAILSITPELIGLALPKSASDSQLLDAAEKADALAIGPGMGHSPAAKRRLMKLLKLSKPMVVDADALNILAAGKTWPRAKAACVLTPHPGEMSRLAKLFGRSKVPSDHEGRIEIAIEAAKTFGQVIVLKGSRTVVTDGDRVYLNTTGDSSLSKAGTGDVLSGMLATLLAQEMDRFDAACAAVWLHGRAGEIAGKKLGMRCVLAREVIDALPVAIAEYANTDPVRQKLARPEA